VLAGVNAVLEHLRCDPKAVRRVIVAGGARGGASRVIEEARRLGVAVDVEDPRRVSSLAGGVTHQGVVALVDAHRYGDWGEVLGRKPACVLVADQITDPRNLGAMVRSAEAAEVGAVVIPRDRAAGVTSVAVRAAAGATAFVPIVRVTNVARALEELKKAGYWIVGLDGEARDSVFGFAFPERTALVAGSEGKGLRALTRSLCDFLVAIPMHGRVESLNVSVAVAVALFERLRQRIDTPGSR
jgi:23S rRNA (guanosine2251-2'-O)-methyltransferase